MGLENRRSRRSGRGPIANPVPHSTPSALVRLWRPQYAVTVSLTPLGVLIRSLLVGRDSGLYAVGVICCERPGRTDMACSKSTAAICV
jgi:hypothetical protein